MARMGKLGRAISVAALTFLGYSTASNAATYVSSQQEQQESLQEKVERRWGDWVKDADRGPIFERDRVRSYTKYFGDPKEEGFQLPDEVTIGEKVIDLVDSSEVSEYKRKEEVDYGFYIKIGDVTIFPTVLTANNEERESNKEKLEKRLTAEIEILMWGLGLSEADIENADGYSTTFNYGFPETHIKKFGEDGYKVTIAASVKTTFYFKEEKPLPNIFKTARARRDRRA